MYKTNISHPYKFNFISVDNKLFISFKVLKTGHKIVNSVEIDRFVDINIAKKYLIEKCIDQIDDNQLVSKLVLGSKNQPTNKKNKLRINQKKNIWYSIFIFTSFTAMILILVASIYGSFILHPIYGLGTVLLIMTGSLMSIKYKVFG